ncbi:helix-turn-helix domain-containing protein [Chitinophagaceae bacterium 26-R-25]|nr:helix-turn-helix domain-containing protein [Chitinophagaceae bacterium 26-R-25]
MKVAYLLPDRKIAEYVQSILVIENYEVRTPFILPLFANGMPTLLFQSAKGKINNYSNYLTLFGQTVLPDTITLTENFTLIAYFFKPFVLTSLFNIEANELTDKPGDLRSLTSSMANSLQEQLLNSATPKEMIALINRYVLDLAAKSKKDAQILKYVTEKIVQNPDKDALIKVQKELYITERTFQRMFENNIGVSPNQYRRIAQFNAAFEQLNKRQFRSLSDIVFKNNYSDQSHFIRTFKEFTNLTPKEYLKFGTAD